jgi:energy-converting hydrogenase B subunit D
MTEALQSIALALVAAGGTAVVLTREPLRQTFVLSLYGFVLAILFLVVQAPDVAFSELAVGTVAVPLLILLALSKVRSKDE